MAAVSIPPRCPSCGSEHVDRFVYGLVSGPPDPADHVLLGGCIILPGQPDFHCTGCGNEWAADDSPDGRQRATTEGEPDP